MSESLFSVFVVVSVLRMFYCLPTHKNEEPIIKFPTDDQETPQCDEKETFCDNVENYPQDKMYRLLKNSNYTRKDFNFNNASLDNRFYGSNEHYICNSIEKTYFPRVALNLNGEPRFIFNFGDYIQAVTVEECTNKKESVFKSVLRDKNAKCVQIEQTVLLLAVTGDQPVWDSFSFPAYCACTYNDGINFFTRRIGQATEWKYNSISELSFPTSEENPSNQELTPECAGDQIFCENVTNYPSKLLNDTLHIPNYRRKYANIPNLLKNNALTVRHNKHNCLCPYHTTTIYPKAAYNIKNQLKFIFNLDEYQQGVEISYCIEESHCKFFEKPQHFATQCKQKYTIRRLLTFDSEMEPYMDRYRFPSGCVCSYKTQSKFSKKFKNQKFVF